ncbi:hypothetical protein QIW57_01240 [Francisellaceae bacterium CB52]
MQKVSKIKYQRRAYFTHRISKARQWLSRYLWISKARMFSGVRKTSFSGHYSWWTGLFYELVLVG